MFRKKRKREMDVVDFVVIRGQKKQNQLIPTKKKIDRTINFLKNRKITHISLKQWGFYFQVA